MNPIGRPGADGEDVLFVFNGRSRCGRRAEAEARRAAGLLGLARARWVPITDLSRLSPGDVRPRRAIALGGDGTVGSVAEWLLSTAAGDGEPAALGIVPCGTGNNLARALGIPFDVAPAVERAALGEVRRRIDAVRYEPVGAPGTGGARVFVQSAQLGFPAEINDRFHRLRRHPVARLAIHPLGRLAYQVLALAGIARRRLREHRGSMEGRLIFRAELPGETVETEVLAVFFGNDRTLGGGFIPCPRASLDDGLLDICWVRGGTRSSYLRLFRAVTRGAHLARTDVVEYRQTPGPVEVRLSESAPFLADGDIRTSAPGYRIELLPAAISVAAG